MKKIKIVLMILVSTFIISCESKTYEEISVITKNPTYTKNIKPVVKSNCLSCHFDDNEFPNLETYEEVKEATIEGQLICRIDQTQSCGEVMPQSGPMQKTTIDMFLLWKEQGCPN